MREAYSIPQQWTTSWSACDVWWKVVYVWQPAMPSSVAGPRSSSKAQAKLAPQRPCSLSGGLPLAWSTTAFWVLPKPLQLRGALGKSMSAPSATLTAGTDQNGPSSPPQQCPTAHHTTDASKAELWGFASSTLLTWSLNKQLPLL